MRRQAHHKKECVSHLRNRILFGSNETKSLFQIEFQELHFMTSDIFIWKSCDRFTVPYSIVVPANTLLPTDSHSQAHHPPLYQRDFI